MNDKIDIELSWKEQLEEEFEKEYFQNLRAFVCHEYATKKIFPQARNIFKAFNTTPFADVKVVIIGQDPYHGNGQANGLSFSVNEGIALPPSLRNIFKEIASDLNTKPPISGDLTRWARQGVLLLNSTLTVVSGLPNSHQTAGWDKFTDAAIEKISDNKESVVFLLWGAFAQKKECLIDVSKHLILKAAHPSPFSAHRGFFGCRHFSKTNEYLRNKNLKEIEWGACEC